MTEQSANAVFLHLPRSASAGPAAEGDAWRRLMRAFARLGGAEEFYVHALARAHFDDGRAELLGAGGEPRPCHWVPPGGLGGDGVPPALVLPGATLAPFAWRRRAADRDRAYSLVGILEQLTEPGVFDDVAHLAGAPLQPWDVVVCPSRAAEGAFRRILEECGGTRSEVPTRVIPFGVDCGAFAETSETRAIRGRVRRGLGIGEDDIALLLFGRFSYRDGRHPIAAYLAAEEAAKRTGRRCFLIHAGRFPAAEIEREFRDAARAFAPSTRCIFLDGDEPDVRGNVWFAADIFMALDDGVGEMADAAVPMAMASGLPVLASDWGALREAVRHGVEGFLAPTWLPEPGQGTDLALAPELDLIPEARAQAFAQQNGIVSQVAAVDVRAAAEALAVLAADADMRRVFGEAGRGRARETFDWQTVVARHQALWRELAGLRADPSARTVSGGSDAGLRAPSARHFPARGRGDPFARLADYPSHRIGAGTLLSLASASDVARLGTLARFGMNGFAASVLPELGELETMIAGLAQGGTARAADIALLLPPERQGLAGRGIAWLAKMGLLALGPEAGEPGTDGQEQENEPPETADATQGLMAEARAAEREGDVNRAVALWREILALSPDHVEANLRLGEILAGACDMAAAREHFRRAAEADPASAAAHCALGRALALQGDVEGALTSFRRAGRAAPEAFEPMFLLGATLRRSGATFESVQILRAVAGRFPERPEGHYQLGLALKAQGRRAEAMEALRKGLGLAPDDVFLQAAQASLRLDLAGVMPVGMHSHDGRPSRSRKGGRVAMFFSRPHHYLVLKPLFERLAERQWPLLGGDWREIADFAPDLVVACEAFPKDMRRLVPGAATLYLQTTFTAAEEETAASGADIAAAIGPQDRDRFARAGIPDDRIWIVGAVKLDPLLRGTATRPAFLPSGGKVVLFAPTYHPSLSAAPMLGERAVECLRGDRSDVAVVIKPHPVTCTHQPHWLAWWRRAAAEQPNVHLIESAAADIVPLLAAADVLVADCSNVMFEFLAVDRPIVLVENPDRLGAAGRFDRSAQEWTMRGIGERVAAAAGLAGAVARALDGADPARSIRAECRRSLYGDGIDGHALDRLVERIESILA